MAALRARELAGGTFAPPGSGRATASRPHGALAAALGAARLYRRAPPRLTVPMPSLLAQAPLLGQCVVLGFSRCGGYLYSYSFDAGLRFQLEVWALAPPGTGGFVGRRHTDLPAGSGGGARIRLHAAVPLFPSADWAAASAMGALLDGEAVRVTLWEPPDSGCIVALGFLHEKAPPPPPSSGGMRPAARASAGAPSRVPLPCHVTIVPSPSRVPGAPMFHDAPTLLAPPEAGGGHSSADADGARPVPVPPAVLAALNGPGDDEGDDADEEDDDELDADDGPHGRADMPPPRSSLNAVHFSFTVQAPYPRPVVLGLDRVVAAGQGAATTYRYRLVLNSGDALRVVTFRVRPGGGLPGVGGGDDAAYVDAASDGTASPAWPWWAELTATARAHTQATLADADGARSYVAAAGLGEALSARAAVLLASSTRAAVDETPSAVDHRHLHPALASAHTVWGVGAGTGAPSSAVTPAFVNAHGVPVYLQPALAALDSAVVRATDGDATDGDGGYQLDPRCACGSVVVESLRVLDVEQLLRTTVRGRAVNYDARLVAVAHTGEAVSRGWAAAPSASSSEDEDGAGTAGYSVVQLTPTPSTLVVDSRYVVVAVVVDHRLEETPASRAGAAAQPAATVPADPQLRASAGNDAGAAGGGVDLALLLADDTVGQAAAAASERQHDEAISRAAEAITAGQPQPVAGAGGAPRRVLRYGGAAADALAKDTSGSSAADLDTSTSSVHSGGSAVAGAAAAATNTSLASDWDDVLTDESASSSASPPTTGTPSPTAAPGQRNGFAASVTDGTGVGMAAAAAGPPRAGDPWDPAFEHPLGPPTAAVDAAPAAPARNALAAVADAAVSAPRRESETLLATAAEPGTGKALVANAAPPVRSQLVVCLDVATGAIRVLRLGKLPPHQQPAFDRGLPAITSQLVTQLRASLVPATSLPGRLSRELSNDALLSGQSLKRLPHPNLPLAVVL